MRMLEKRKVYTFSAPEIQSLRLREIEGGNRLTIDQGNRRVELAVGVTEIEREWVHRVLHEVYRLGGRAAGGDSDSPVSTGASGVYVVIVMIWSGVSAARAPSTRASMRATLTSGSASACQLVAVPGKTM